MKLYLHPVPHRQQFRPHWVVSLACGVLALLLAPLGVILNSAIIVGLGGAFIACGLTAILWGLALERD